MKLCHMIGNWLNFIIPDQKFGSLPPAKKFGQFCTNSDFYREYLRNEATYPKWENVTNYVWKFLLRLTFKKV